MIGAAISLGCATAIPLPSVGELEQLSAEQEMGAASLSDLEHDASIRYWEIFLTDERTHAALTSEQREALAEVPLREAAERMHRSFSASAGFDVVEAARISPRVVRGIAASAEPQVASQLYGMAATLDNLQEVVHDRIRLVGGRILESAGRRNVALLPEPEVGLNAFVPVEFGSDRVYVGTELALSASSDDELACAIGHELAHLTQGHTTSGAWVNVGKLTISIAATAALAVAMANANDGEPLSQGQIDAALQAGQLAGFVLSDVPLRLGGWFRGQEREADAVGLYYAWRAGYRPEACANLMIRMGRNAAANGGAEGIWWWNVHPMSSERVVILRKLAEQARAGVLPAPR